MSKLENVFGLKLSFEFKLKICLKEFVMQFLFFSGQPKAIRPKTQLGLFFGLLFFFRSWPFGQILAQLPSRLPLAQHHHRPSRSPPPYTASPLPPAHRVDAPSPPLHSPSFIDHVVASPSSN
jgi:hypothetical protein